MAEWDVVKTEPVAAADPWAVKSVASPSFDTQLSTTEEASFAAWKSQYAPKDSGADYDLRGAFKSGLMPDPATGHWSDVYKKPNHPTFSNQSMYATGENAAKAGRWEGEKFIPPASTTAPGIAASAARGLAPYAAGAGIGAAVGAPFAGVGAGPGALAGMGAVAATELGGTLYNMIAPRVSRLPQIMTPQGATDRLLDAFGIRRPTTPIEHGAEFLAGMAPFGIGSSAGRAVAAGARETRAEKYIEDAYDRAIRPTVVGKGNRRQIDQADENVASALHSIIDNKPALRLETNKGNEVIGRSPRTLDEFVQAIAQTMRPVFHKYDGLAQQAEALGVKIDAAPAVAELRKFAADPSFALPAHKAMREYAAETANTLEALGALPPTVAQGMVRNLNEGLSAFYRKSSPEAASRAGVDDLVANQLRTHVDAALERAGLPGWQEARNEYGALKAIESEVAHRAVVYGRQDSAGGLFGRLGSIASYEELARFALSHDPAALASAAAIRGGRKWIEYWHGPNATVRRMFKKAEEFHEPAPASGAGPTGGGTPITPTGGMQPPRPSGPGQNATGGTSTGVASGGSARPPAAMPQSFPPGQQPPRPTGPIQAVPQGGGTLQGGGSAVTIPTPRGRGTPPGPIDPFLTPPGGGRVSRLIDPDDPIARALGYVA